MPARNPGRAKGFPGDADYDPGDLPDTEDVEIGLGEKLDFKLGVPVRLVFKAHKTQVLTEQLDEAGEVVVEGGTAAAATFWRYTGRNPDGTCKEDGEVCFAWKSYYLRDGLEDAEKGDFVTLTYERDEETPARQGRGTWRTKVFKVQIARKDTLLRKTS